jgi:hypothetical protein
MGPIAGGFAVPVMAAIGVGAAGVSEVLGASGTLESGLAGSVCCAELWRGRAIKPGIAARQTNRDAVENKVRINLYLS